MGRQMLANEWGNIGPLLRDGDEAPSSSLGLDSLSKREAIPIGQANALSGEGASSASSQAR